MEVDDPQVNGIVKEKKDQGIKDYYVCKIEEIQVGVHMPLCYDPLVSIQKYGLWKNCMY